MKKDEAQKRPQKPMWTVEGGEVLENGDLIEYYKLHRLDEKYENKLLGEYNAEGKYVLPEEIKMPLVKVKKRLTEKQEDVIVCQSELKHKTIEFKIKFWKVENEGVASLYMIEHAGESEIVSFVAQYIGQAEEGFVEKVKKAFSVFNDIEDFSDEFAETIDKLIEEMSRKYDERCFVVELQSEYFVMEMLELLKDGGLMCQRIYEKFSALYEQQKGLINKGQMFTRLRHELDKMIIAEGGFNELVKENPKFIKTTLVFTKPVKEYDRISERLDALSQPKEVKKAAAAKKKAAAAKGAKLPKPKAPYQAKAGKDAKKAKDKAKDDIMLKYKEEKKKDAFETPKAEPPKKEPVKQEPAQEKPREDEVKVAPKSTFAMFASRGIIKGEEQEVSIWTKGNPTRKLFVAQASDEINLSR